MSNFKMKKIGTYTFGFSGKGEPMQKLVFDPKELARVKEWDLGKIYILNPSKKGGNIIGLIDESSN